MKLSSGVLSFLVPPKRPKPLRFEIEGSSSITAIHGTEGTVTVTATPEDGDPVVFEARVRIDTPKERDYYRNGGILHYVLRQLAD